MKASVPKRFSCPGAPITLSLSGSLAGWALGGAVSRPHLEPTAPCDRAFDSLRSFSATTHSGLSAFVLTASQPFSEPTAPADRAFGSGRHPVGHRSNGSDRVTRLAFAADTPEARSQSKRVAPVTADRSTPAAQPAGMTPPQPISRVPIRGARRRTGGTEQTIPIRSVSTVLGPAKWTGSAHYGGARRAQPPERGAPRAHRCNGLCRAVGGALWGSAAAAERLDRIKTLAAQG